MWELRLRSYLLLGAVCVLLLSTTEVVQGVGVFYADPSWAYAFDGDEAFYNDPDGPHPDPVNGTDNNSPGGQSGTPALVDPKGNGGVVEWTHHGQQWDGSAPGDPLGYLLPNSPPLGTPPIPPAAPGGVATYTEDGTTFLRIQNPGNPQGFGWADKGAQSAPGAARQEGNMRRSSFRHDIGNDPTYSGDPAVLDNGITVSFRVRLATKDDGPLDDLFVEGASSVDQIVPWPTDGLGYEVSGNGRGMFFITQSTPVGEAQVAFSLLDDNTVTFEALEGNVGTLRGLAMTNQANPAQSANTNDATPETANVFEIRNAELSNWQEFWITIEGLPCTLSNTCTPADNRYEINVYHNGSLTPQTFEVIPGLENEFGTSANLGFGLTSDSRQGAFDLDFYAYKEGIHFPTLALVGNGGDYNGNGRVDAADFTIWRDNLGASGTPGSVSGDGTTTDDLLGLPDGFVDQWDYDYWVQEFGNIVSGSGSGDGAVPEPQSVLLLAIGWGLCLAPRGLRRR